MKKEEAAEILIQHNEYRRGGEGVPYRPHIIGEALDLAIEALRERPEPENADEQLDSLIEELDEGNMTLNELRERLLKWKNGFTSALRESAEREESRPTNNLIELTKRVADGMTGIGGIPDKEEFYAEFASRLWDALGLQPLQFDDLLIDDLPIEDVAIIEMWLESLRMSPSVQSITIRLSDGETLYTVKNERP